MIVRERRNPEKRTMGGQLIKKNAPASGITSRGSSAPCESNCQRQKNPSHGKGEIHQGTKEDRQDPPLSRARIVNLLVTEEVEKPHTGKNSCPLPISALVGNKGKGGNKEEEMGN